MDSITTPPEKTKRRAANLTIRADLLQQAKSLGLNTSRAAEAGIAAAVKTARERQWLEENKDAIAAYNERIEKQGLLLTPYWAEE